jgi:hypothetical protein
MGLSFSPCTAATCPELHMESSPELKATRAWIVVPRSGCESMERVPFTSFSRSWVMTNEVVKKAMIATAFRGSSTRKEKIGRAKKYAKHSTAITETTADETKAPLRDNSTTTIR